MKKKVYQFAEGFKRKFIIFILMLPGFFVIFPIIILITGSVMDQYELKEYLNPIFNGFSDFISWKLMPDYPSFANYGKLLFMTPQFFVLFWNSMRMTACILAGQILVGVPAAWAFAVYRVKGSKILFALYVILMLLPFQVTMLSSYLVLNRLSLLNTQQAIILPAIFSTFPVFLTYGGFRSIPNQLFEAARVDGASERVIFFKIGLPLGKSGLLSAMVLGFLEYWNMMEQPMAFLDEQALWPLSLYLPQINWSQAGFAFCASVIILIPAVFIFTFGQDYLEQGIIYSGLKE
ncbi:carbohydrate ABC transporter permease [Parablautia muri]|uniref:Carbohydrate ABC transporter permease n=1 Tax=Parablautia muri TaxID=2320879 RepID=A0A9X5BCC5_9FIRM|nr:carbohydrate ABC transporter permease [Parablautia muri]NBJ91042.1 carbohydrate ABC transporter permease [Parablautia muri]